LSIWTIFDMISLNRCREMWPCYCMSFIFLHVQCTC